MTKEMIEQLGDRERFAVGIGGRIEDGAGDGLRVVRLWAGGRELSCDDDCAYVPQFCRALAASIPAGSAETRRGLPFPNGSPEENHRRLEADDTSNERRRFRFMDWGPTTDNLVAFRFVRGDESIITFRFWRSDHPRAEERGRIFVVEVPTRELIAILARSVELLRQDGSREG